MNQKTKKYLMIILSICLSMVVVYLLCKIVDFKFLVNKIKELNIIYLIVSSLFLVFAYFFRVGRYEIILEKKNNRTVLFSISTIHYFLNRVLPARTGEISLPLLFKKHLQIAYNKGIGALMFFRILDLFSIAIIFTLSLGFSGVTLEFKWLFYFISIALMVFIILFFVLLKPVVSVINVKIKNKKIQQTLTSLKAYLIGLSLKKVLILLIISIFNWLVTYCYYFFLLKAFYLNLSFMEVLFATSFSVLSFMFPINLVGNVGPFETGWAIGFFFLGMNKETSVPLGLFSNIFATLVTAALAFAGFLILRQTKKHILNKE